MHEYMYLIFSSLNLLELLQYDCFLFELVASMAAKRPEKKTGTEQ